MRKLFTILGLTLLCFALVSYLGCKKEEETTAETTTTTEAETKRIGTVSAGPLNMRSQPAMDGKVIVVLHKGEQLEVLEESPNMETIDNITAYWYRVRTSKGDEGWVFGGYLTFGTTTTTTTPTTITPTPTVDIGGGSLPSADTSTVPGGLSYKECYQQGKSYSSSGDYSTAIAYLTRACELNADYGPAYFELGLAYQEYGDNHKAVQAYEKAIGLQSDDFWTHNNLGLAYIRIGDYEKAVTVLKKALTLDPAGCSTPQAKENAYNIARNNLEAAERML